MSNQIEGVPNGYELVRIGKPRQGEWVVNEKGYILNWVNVNQDLVWPIVRKIEKPKRYRPFANAEEFKPHKFRWVRMKNTDEGNSYQITGFGNTYVWIGPVTTRLLWDTVFKNYVFDDDGSPFGVEITDENPS